MYYYIYDIFTSEKHYRKEISKMEVILSNMGISGKVYKLNILKNLEEIIEEAVNNHVKNIIAVGNDKLVGNLANLLVDKNIALGVIPIGEPNNLANYFDITSIAQACQIISARKILEIDVGKINGQYFFMSLEIEDNDVHLELDGFNISPRSNNSNVGIYKDRKSVV